MRLIISITIFLFISGCLMKTPMVASPTGDGKYWIIKEPLVYEHPVTKQTYTVPRGFVTDLASVPRLFWSAFPPCDRYTPPAVVHDYLYWAQLPGCDRKCADDILFITMKEARVNKATRDTIYAAVRVGGKRSWDGNARLKDSGIIRMVPEEHMNFGPYDTWKQIENRIKN